MSSFTAKSLDEALELAAQELGCDKETITYTVVEEKKGVLGLGASVTIEAKCCGRRKTKSEVIGEDAKQD